MKTTYCIIETPSFAGRKCKPAQITKEFTSRKAAENSNHCARRSDVITKKQADAIIKKWNKEYFDGDFKTS